MSAVKEITFSEKLFHSSRIKITPVTPKFAKTFSIDLASYFQPWFNFCYYFLLVPFKIEYDGSAYITRTNMFQKTLCGLLHPIICINSFFEFHEKFIEKVRNVPEIFMRALERFNTILLCFFFFYMVWFRKAAIIDICNESRSPTSVEKNITEQQRVSDPKKVKRSVRLWCVILLSYSFLAFGAYNVGIDNSEWTLLFQNMIQKFQFEYYFTPNLELENHDVPVSELMIMAVTAAVFLRLYKWILVDFIISLALMVGIASYKTCKQFKIILTNSDSTNNGINDGRIFEAYSKLASLFNKLNAITGPTFAVVFLFITTFCAVHTMGILDSDSWSFPIFMIGYMLYLFLTMVFPAEAHYQASYFKTWLLLRHQNGGSLTNLTGYLLEAEGCNLAIKGGRCFALTYPFLGTASSVILTYAIIMIQFGGGKCISKETGNLN